MGQVKTPLSKLYISFRSEGEVIENLVLQLLDAAISTAIAALERGKALYDKCDVRKLIEGSSTINETEIINMSKGPDAKAFRKFVDSMDDLMTPQLIAEEMQKPFPSAAMLEKVEAACDSWLARYEAFIANSDTLKATCVAVQAMFWSLKDACRCRYQSVKLTLSRKTRVSNTHLELMSYVPREARSGWISLSLFSRTWICTGGWRIRTSSCCSNRA